MIRKQEAMAVETRENMRGGTGTITFQHFFKAEDFKARVRLCAKLTIPPGTSIGMHAHEQEDEIYLILGGTGVLSDGGAESRVTAGDAVLTGKGGSHAVRNDGNEPLEIAAVIVTY